MDKNKLTDKLKSQFGLISGTDWAKQRKNTETPSFPDPAAPPSEEKEAPFPSSSTAPTDRAGDSARRLRERLGLLSGLEVRAAGLSAKSNSSSQSAEIDQVVGGEILGDDNGAFLRVRRDYPIEHFHGAFALSAALAGRPEHLALVGNDDTLVDCDLHKALFIDTETTGLSGGSGTVAFLVGLGRFTGDGLFRLDQCFMRDYDDEEAMLHYLADAFRECTTIISFNGKSFDLPLLRTRFIQQRIPFRLDGLLHLDLVHTARRLWKRRLADCSLGNLEREVLSVERHGDVPSYLIPQLWLDYLYSRDARPLEGVFYHHRYDILSMVTLVGLLAERLDRSDGAAFEHAEDQLSLVRLHFKRRQYEKVIEMAPPFLDQTPPPSLRRECREMLALACKRRNRFTELYEALQAWHEEFPADAEAAAEYAKYLEHRLRDWKGAVRVCQKTLDHLQSSGSFYRDMARNPMRIALEQRMERIERKIARGNRPEDDIFDEDP